jgi:hypothetical protein
MSELLPLAVAALEDLRDDLRIKANQSFFQSKFVTHADFVKHETTIRNCLNLLATIPREDPLPPQAGWELDC